MRDHYMLRVFEIIHSSPRGCVQEDAAQDRAEMGVNINY